MSALYLRDPRGNGSWEDPRRVTCGCDDPLAHSVAALAAGGMGLRDACLRVYSDEWAARSRAITSRRFEAAYPFQCDCGVKVRAGHMIARVGDGYVCGTCAA